MDGPDAPAGSANVLPIEDAGTDVGAGAVDNNYSTSGTKRFGKVVKFGEKKQIREKHIHDMKETTTKVLLSGNGYDILAQRKCSCGRTETYDIKERVKM